MTKSFITPKELYTWCRVPFDQLEDHPDRKLPFRMVADSRAMGLIMAQDLVDEIQLNNGKNRETRAIIPCGPSCWYQPFTNLVNAENVSLQKLVVFHMDECLDWQGRELPKKHPYNFRGFMETHFYDPVKPELTVPVQNRNWLNAHNIAEVKSRINEAPLDITYGGWGQDGHIAYNQARRNSFSPLTL
ncbi:MAG TPA: hypothetical protein PKE30_08295 [Niabella sp.]|nr:hypothetical protein [Niabella sp.]